MSCGRPGLHVGDDPARAGRATSAPRRARLSRPVSRRATSRSSVISRLSRSASAWTVVSISSFCSSLSRVQRLSMAWTKPFTPVSGDRSSWATAATRSDRSRSRRARPRPERTETATPVGGPSGSSRRIRAVTRHSLPSGSTHDCSGTPVRVLRPLERRVVLQPGTSVVAGQREHVDELRPDHLRAVDAEQLLRGPVDQHHGLVAVEDDDAVGQDVDRLTRTPTSRPAR